MYQIEELEKWKDKPEKIVYRYSASGDKWICLILKKRLCCWRTLS